MTLTSHCQILDKHSMSSVLTGKIVVGQTNYDLFPDQMSDVFRDRFHDLYFLSMRDYKE
jgi:hypothetical protein